MLLNFKTNWYSYILKPGHAITCIKSLLFNDTVLNSDEHKHTSNEYGSQNWRYKHHEIIRIHY